MKEIKMTNGGVAMVDDVDFDYISKWKWYKFKPTRGKTFYAKRTTDDKLMHRLILNITDSNIFIDHKNHDGLNNIRENLRVATSSQNNANIESHKDGTSKYLGVSFASSNF